MLAPTNQFLPNGLETTVEMSHGDLPAEWVEDMTTAWLCKFELGVNVFPIHRWTAAVIGPDRSCRVACRFAWRAASRGTLMPTVLPRGYLRLVPLRAMSVRFAAGAATSGFAGVCSAVQS